MIKQERAERTREAIIRAAAAVFERDGFTTAPLGDITRKATVTKGALYFHFTSKEELAFAIIDAEEQAAGELIESVMSTDSPPLQKLIDISFRWAHLIQSNPIVQAGLRMIIEQGTYSRPMPLPYNAWQELSAQLLTQAQERGELERSVDVRSMAEFIVSSFTGAQIVSQVVSGHKDLVQRVERMWQLLLKGILPPGNPIVFFPRFES